jgi:hypothetical protein
MPWSVTKGGGNCAASKWAVVNKQTGQTMGCHDTQESANRQLAALNVNVKHSDPGGSMANPLHESTTLEKAADVAGLKSGRMLVQAISAGVGTSGYYSPEVLERAARDRLITRGTPLHVDHMSETERQDRPERSVNTIAGVFTSDIRYDSERRALVGDAQIFQPFRERLAEMAPYIGLSITGSASDIVEGEFEGRKVPVVEGLAAIDSVDFVTKAGRGGQVLLAESAQQNTAVIDHVNATYGQALSEVGLQIVRVTETANPDPAPEPVPPAELPAGTPPETPEPAAESAGPPPPTEEHNMPPDNAQGAPTGSPRQVIEAQVAEMRSEVAQMRARERARDVIAETLNDAWLTPSVVNRLTGELLVSLPIVNDALDEAALRESAARVRDTAEAEVAEALTAAGVGKPRGLGALTASAGGGKAEDITARLEESFKAQGMSPEAAKIAAKGR